MDNPKPTRAKRGQPEPVRVEPEVTVGDVRRAAAVLKGAVLNTDFDHSRTLSDMLGCKVWLKFENLQFTASFKERGALNRLSRCPTTNGGAA